jgi:hypothetical protein
MGDDDESAFFEALKADQEQRPSALIDSQTSDVGPPPAEYSFVVKRKRSRAPRNRGLPEGCAAGSGELGRISRVVPQIEAI